MGITVRQPAPRNASIRTAPIRTSAGLVEAGLAEATALPVLEQVAASFAVSVTDQMAGLIDPTDPNDPVARQFIPAGEELRTTPGELADPIGDGPHSPVKGIVHRYRDRVLLKAVNVCPVYCRFCFRREMVGPGSETLDGAELDTALAYIAEHEEVWEVILTGGDPLILSPRRLAEIVTRLDAIPHVGIVRFHTRVPVVDPDRVTPELVAALKGKRIASWLMLHANHWRELDDTARGAIARLVDAGIPLLSQTVLLKGVNDDAETLTRTFRALVQARVKPHYLHQGDLAKGTAHFRTTIQRGRALMRELRGDVSGLCQPTYVLDIPGGHGKVPLTADYLAPDGEGGWTVTDPRGGRHAYSEEVE
ncbi:lysine-2,3-aminomutase-like protein [Nitrospirillum viridazoti]|uniref:Lysine 2,3-aminomutase n=1 Tax=Nitrospirillum viridazoti CBAmc TaxID=1441467 RepID=A0A248JMN5_9PROT|nr:lysine-2,3-aminomutase-like protein [Nitrospirillum amazonense]ASG19504.1 lysine 2,3-aminomutase [Nitrospirillum amazonense CBAmc]TWB26737.1 lysine 2,3-aminomutase [Nitrospirillum amazonense]